MDMQGAFWNHWGQKKILFESCDVQREVCLHIQRLRAHIITQLSLVCTYVQAHQSVQFFAVQLSDMAGVWMDSVFLQDILPYELPPLGEFEVDNKEKESLRLLHFKVNWWTVIDWLEFHCKGSVLHFGLLFVDNEHIETSSSSAMSVLLLLTVVFLWRLHNRAGGCGSTGLLPESGEVDFVQSYCRLPVWWRRKMFLRSEQIWAQGHREMKSIW